MTGIDGLESERYDTVSVVLMHGEIVEEPGKGWCEECNPASPSV